MCNEEKFTKDQTIAAVESFLEYGEKEYGKSQQGYFSGRGWAARCLRFHLKSLKEDTADDVQET